MPNPSVERIQLGDLTCWRARYANNELLISQQGAQILSYTEAGKPLIWLSDQATYKKGQPVRGGVPICWPWFANLQHNPTQVQNMHSTPTAAPAHGLLRGVDWHLQGIQCEDDKIQFDFVFNTADTPQPDWPHAAEIHFRVRLDERLHMELTTRNLGRNDLSYSQALHTYFAVSDIRQVHVDGLQGCHYLDCLDGWAQKTLIDLQTFNGETDRVYLETPDTLSIIDKSWNRRIHLQSSGSRSAVVWNPWTDKSLRLSQFAADAWQGMLCIEHANAADDARVLSFGEQHSLSAIIWSDSAI
jgi:glucose-6-phosphate 1-epimerase